MVLIVLLMAAILIFTAAFFGRLTNYIHFGATTVANEQAVNAAEAGIDYALWQLNQTAGSFNPSPTPTPLGTTGKFTVGVTTKSAILKSITSTGCVPDCDNPRAKRTIKVDAQIDTTIIAFNFGVQVGNGGLSLNNSARVSGSVYSNKTGTDSIKGNQFSVITGDAWAAGTISTPDPTVGPPGCGAACKHENQPSPPPMPTVDYNYWKGQATNCSGCQTINCSATCTPTGDTIGKTKYAGNLSLSQDQVVRMTGPVYVTGNLNLGQGSKINLDPSFGSTSTVLILDGTISVGQSATVNPTDANPKGYIMLVTTSIATPAVSIGQSGVYAIIYALEGGVDLGQSANATAIIAKQLNLGNSAVLTYDIGLGSTGFTSGPGGSWQIRKGTYLFK